MPCGSQTVSVWERGGCYLSGLKHGIEGSSRLMPSSSACPSLKSVKRAKAPALTICSSSTVPKRQHILTHLTTDMCVYRVMFWIINFILMRMGLKRQFFLCCSHFFVDRWTVYILCMSKFHYCNKLVQESHLLHLCLCMCVWNFFPEQLVLYGSAYL